MNKLKKMGAKAFELFLVVFFTWNILGITMMPIESKSIHGKTPAVKISREVNQKLNERWNNYYPNEFAVCLIEKDGIYVGLFDPKIYSSTNDSVNSDNCPENATLEMHSHTNDNIWLSEVDKENIWNNTKSRDIDHIKFKAIMINQSDYRIFDKFDVLHEYLGINQTFIAMPYAYRIVKP